MERIFQNNHYRQKKGDNLFLEITVPFFDI